MLAAIYPLKVLLLMLSDLVYPHPVDAIAYLATSRVPNELMIGPGAPADRRPVISVGGGVPVGGGDRDSIPPPAAAGGQSEDGQ